MRSGWKSVLEKVTLERRGPPGGPQRCPMTSDGRSKDDPTLVLATSNDDIICLWEGEAIQALKNAGYIWKINPSFSSMIWTELRR